MENKKPLFGTQKQKDTFLYGFVWGTVGGMLFGFTQYFGVLVGLFVILLIVSQDKILGRTLWED